MLEVISENTLASSEHIKDSLATTQEAWRAYEGKFGQIEDSLKEIFETLEKGLMDYNKITSESISTYLIDLDNYTANAMKNIAGTIEELKEILESLEDIRGSEEGEG